MKVIFVIFLFLIFLVCQPLCTPLYLLGHNYTIGDIEISVIGWDK